MHPKCNTNNISLYESMRIQKMYALYILSAIGVSEGLV